MSDTIFFDHVSTTPTDPRVVEKMIPYFSEIYGNPSSHIHAQGILAQKAVEDARSEVASLVGAAPERVIFTSGATEANNLALLGIAQGSDSNRKHVLISEVEHFSVFNTMHPLRAMGFEVEIVPVDNDGVVSAAALQKRLRDDTLLVSIMHANAEIGTIEPIAELSATAHEKGALFHSDAAISAGLIPIDMEKTGIDALTLSAHNFYGPKGVGALVLGENAKPRSRSYGGFQENYLRSGTENVAGIVGMGEAARIAAEEMDGRAAALLELGLMLREGLRKSIPFIHFTGHAGRRLPGHVSFWIEHVEGESLILFLNVKGVMAASGSACSSNLKADDEDGLVASHVLTAVGVPSDICAGSVTFSIGRNNTAEEVKLVLREMPQIVERLMAMSPTYADLKKQQEGNTK